MGPWESGAQCSRPPTRHKYGIVSLACSDIRRPTRATSSPHWQNSSEHMTYFLQGTREYSKAYFINHELQFSPEKFFLWKGGNQAPAMVLISILVHSKGHSWFKCIEYIELYLIIGRCDTAVHAHTVHTGNPTGTVLLSSFQRANPNVKIADS